MALRFIKYNTCLIEEHIKEKGEKTPWPIIVNICLYHNPNEKPYPYSTSVYGLFKDPLTAKALEMFTKFHLADLNSTPNQVLERHGSIGLMEKLLKYSRHRDIFNVIEKELKRSKGWLVVRGDYWKAILIYSSYVIGKEEKSEKDLVSLFKEVLSKNEEEIMITIAQTIEKRGEIRGIQKNKLAIAKNMLAKGYAIKDIEEITGLSREAIEKLKGE